MSIQFIYCSTGVKRVIGGYLDVAGKGSEGKMHVKYATSPLSTETTLVVLDTDYNNYAVVWSCNGVGPLRVRKFRVFCTKNKVI